MKSLLYAALIVAWIWGVGLANGFWQSAAAYVLPPYAWVLVAEDFQEKGHAE